ncbi:hypothetical protein PspLS_03496, partial [Pyricularia sp. CBS 133598]
MTEGVRVDPSLTALLRCGLRATPVRPQAWKASFAKGKSSVTQRDGVTSKFGPTVGGCLCLALCLTVLFGCTRRGLPECMRSRRVTLSKKVFAMSPAPV